MMLKPIIAIALDSQNGAKQHSYSEYDWYALRKDYSNAVTRNGGVPILLPFDDKSIDEVLSISDGLIIPGGDVDIDPAFYGQKILSNTVVTNPARTEYDMKLLEKALTKQIPFLGICYGMQLLNVFFGGSLIQDIEQTNIIHRQPSPKHLPWHEIDIEPSTNLASIAQNQLSWTVNSTHHQAVDVVGKDLIISAHAPDGIIEAIEHPQHKFTLGVEWHPEYQEMQLDKNIFKAFAIAASSYKASRLEG